MTDIADRLTAFIKAYEVTYNGESQACQLLRDCLSHLTAPPPDSEPEIKVMHGCHLVPYVRKADSIAAELAAHNRGFALAHKPAKCGHARANYKDPDWGTDKYQGNEKCEFCAAISAPLPEEIARLLNRLDRCLAMVSGAEPNHEYMRTQIQQVSELLRSQALEIERLIGDVKMWHDNHTISQEEECAQVAYKDSVTIIVQCIYENIRALAQFPKVSAPHDAAAGDVVATSGDSVT